MQTAEIKELYAQKTGAPPGPAVEKFIDGLKVREVAKIWSMMGDGEDFVTAIKRLIADAVKKAGGEDMGNRDLDSWLLHLDDLKHKAEREKEAEKQRKAEEKVRREHEAAAAAEAEQARQEAEAAAERERAERAEREAAEARRREEETRLREAEAAAAREAAEKAAADAARRESEAREKQALDEQEKAAQAEFLAEAQRQREEAEEAQRVAQQHLETERKAAEDAKKRAEAMVEAQKMLEEEAQRRRDEEAARMQQQAAQRQAEEEAAAAADAADAALEAGSESGHDAGHVDPHADHDSESLGSTGKNQGLGAVPITIKLNAVDEVIGIHGLLALAGKVRAIDLTPGGAAERAGMKAASVICEVHGTPVSTSEELKAAVAEVRKEGLMEFELMIEPPLRKDELTKDVAKIRAERRNIVKEKVVKAMDTCKVLIMDLCIVSAKHLAGTSKNVFCEIKLRAVKDGKVGTDHNNPQKSVTPTVKGSLSPKFDHRARFVVPPNDAIRVSVFGSKAIGKEYKGRVDLVLRDVVPSLNVGGKAIIMQYPLVGEEDGRGAVTGLLEIALRVKGFVRE